MTRFDGCGKTIDQHRVFLGMDRMPYFFWALSQKGRSAKVSGRSVHPPRFILALNAVLAVGLIE